MADNRTLFTQAVSKLIFESMEFLKLLRADMIDNNESSRTPLIDQKLHTMKKIKQMIDTNRNKNNAANELAKDIDFFLMPLIHGYKHYKHNSHDNPRSIDLVKLTQVKVDARIDRIIFLVNEVLTKYHSITRTERSGFMKQVSDTVSRAFQAVKARPRHGGVTAGVGVFMAWLMYRSSVGNM
jgi:ElaB/YqjD/DUF883 family membrane-anchored ribosome-binding protein